MADNEKIDYDKYKGYNIKRMADSLARQATALEQINWNIGFICEIHKRGNPEIAEKIEKEWIAKKAKKDKEQ